MFGWLKPKNVDDVFDKEKGLLTQVGGWIGNMQFTDEERSETKERLDASVASFVEMSLKESTQRSKTRRSIAILWLKFQLALIAIVMAAAPFQMELAKFYAEIAFGTLMVSGTLSVMAFFFGSHMIRSWGERAK